MATYMHNLLLRLTIRELWTGKNELRDHFSITKTLTKPKNTHSPNPPILICPPEKERKHSFISKLKLVKTHKSELV